MQNPLTHNQREKFTIVVIKLVGKQKSEQGITAIWHTLVQQPSAKPRALYRAL